MKRRLEDKIAVVTGAASGLGRACVLRFVEEGASVVVADVQADRAQDLLAQVKKAGGQAVFVETDVTRAEATEAMANRAVEAFGRIDALVTCAGISHGGLVPGRPDTAFGVEMITNPPTILDRPIESWERVLSVNLTGAMLANRAVAKRMVAAGTGGSIVNVSSTAAHQPGLGVGDYCVSKAGVWMLTRVLAQELGPHGIRVNAIAPGTMQTPMSERYLKDENIRKATIQSVPLRRLGEPLDIANAALFLVSDEASYVTAITVGVHGGALA